MVSWSQFPPEIKQKIAENYDFMSRVSMRNTCHVDRQIVDSTKFRIPRVRFGYKEDKCLICIYTGIEKFLRLEIKKCGKGVVVYKSENNFDTSRIPRKFIPSENLLNFGLSILKSLLIHDWIQINAIEWDLDEFLLKDSKNSENFLKIFQKIFGFQKFHVKEMVSTPRSQETYQFFNRFFIDFSHFDELECMRDIFVHTKIDNLYPVIAYDMDVPFCGKSNYHTHLCTVADEEFRTRRRWDYELIHVINGVNYHAIDSGTFRDISEIPIQNPEPRKRTWDMTDVIWEYSCKCGKWSHEMPTSKERALRQKFHTQKCGIGFLCKEHADPFDYWYYQNLPRRLIQEPFWCGMFQGDVVEFGLKLLENYDEQAKREIQNQNPMSSFSWGFKPGEDVHITEKAGIRISRKSNFQNFLKILKFLCFFIFTPILISLISYSLFLAT
ncbi:hypothetical protein B9Z55_026825 [Caenorhabditis nigoni]|nr:hypothetical protein B9Z55_026825 [Caenorhabditis nigoni]